MKKHPYLKALGLFAVIGFVFLQLGAHGAVPAPELVSSAGNSASWLRDVEVSPVSTGAEHYTWKTDPSIDLNVMPVHDDLLASFKKSGVDEFVKDLLVGKNYANHLFGVGETELIQKSVQQSGGLEILTLQLRQKIADDQTIETKEKYFIAEGRAFQIGLRWEKGSDPKAKALADQDFENIQVVRGELVK